MIDLQLQGYLFDTCFVPLGLCARHDPAGTVKRAVGGGPLGLSRVVFTDFYEQSRLVGGRCRLDVALSGKLTDDDETLTKTLTPCRPCL